MDLMSRALESLRLRAVRFERRELVGQGAARLESGHGLLLVEHGSVRLGIDGSNYSLGPGDLALAPRPRARRLRRAGSTAARVLSAELDFAAPDHPLLAALPPLIVVAHARLSQSPYWHEHLGSLRAELDEPKQGSAALVARLTEVLFIHAMRLSPPPTQAECPSSGPLRGLADEQLRPALAAMHDAPGHAWSLLSLASLVGQSRSAFAAYFASVMGEPPMSYLLRWRMFRARTLLRESEVPLGAVAHAVGYGSAAAFSLAFTREHGVSPGAFRNQARERRALEPVRYVAGSSA